MKRNAICVINKVIKIKWEVEKRRGGWIEYKGRNDPQKGTLSQHVEKFFLWRVGT